jgi:hypothetical protein
MNKIAVLHHTKVNLPYELDGDQSFAAYTHMLNFQSEIADADYISFLYLNKVQSYFQFKKFAPWVYFKWISIFFRIPFCIYVCFKYDKLIIYHSNGFYYYFPVFIFFRNKIVIQVNEIYSNVLGNKLSIFLERMYINCFKKLIVSNIHLKENWFSGKKVLVRGGYFRQSVISLVESNRLKNYIYVGSIDNYKMGNLNILLDLVNFIPTNINLYLCLIISDEDFVKVKNAIGTKQNVYIFRDVNDGDLKKHYSICKYGLVLQDSNKSFNLTSFPSKVFSYLNNGLIPVAQKNQSFLKSEINNLFAYIDDWRWSEILELDASSIEIEKIANKLKKELYVFIK